MKIENEILMNWNFIRVAGAMSLMLARMDFTEYEIDLITDAVIGVRILYSEHQIDAAGIQWFARMMPDDLWELIPEDLRGELTDI